MKVAWKAARMNGCALENAFARRKNKERLAYVVYGSCQSFTSTGACPKGVELSGMSPLPAQLGEVAVEPLRRHCGRGPSRYGPFDFGKHAPSRISP